MSDQFESSMNQLIQDQAKSVEDMQAAYPYIKNMCASVVSELYKILKDLEIENLQEAPEPVQRIKLLADGVANEPMNVLLRISESKGFIKAAQTSISFVKKEDQEREQADERIQRVADRLESGDLDLEEKRKVGTRPESLKSIRQAQEKLSQEKDT